MGVTTFEVIIATGRKGWCGNWQPPQPPLRVLRSFGGAVITAAVIIVIGAIVGILLGNLPALQRIALCLPTDLMQVQDTLLTPLTGLVAGSSKRDCSTGRRSNWTPSSYPSALSR